MIKTKEDLALERLKNTLLAEGYWQDILEDVNIIGNALNKYYRLLKEDNETTKKLKALEIIKESTQLSLIEENYGKKEYFIQFNNHTCSEIKTKEEFDILTEVLL